MTNTLVKSVRIDCDELSLAVKIRKGKKKLEVEKSILNSVTASFQPGRLTAIMGSSGAGKTSLLSILAGDLPKKGIVKGELLANGVVCPGRKMKKISGFVFQDDVLFNTMTVREAVTMSAILRLPKSIPEVEKMRRVDEMIGLLGLEKAKDIRIGTPEKKGISGGERKRTAIAMEMVTEPQILFLDEPTSGLDTFTAYSVVSQLKELAQLGRTVVATIHQPSSKTFMLFDDLILLTEGHVVYHGPVSKVLDYLAGLGFVCPAYMNPADFMFMEVLNDAPPTEIDGSVQIKILEGDSIVTGTKSATLISAWERSEEYGTLVNLINESKSKNDGTSTEALPLSQKTLGSFWTQFSFLTKRVSRNMIRNKMVLLARFGRAIFMGLLMASIYYGLDSKKGFAQTQDRINALFFICTNELFSSMGSSIFLFSAERPVFVREYNNGYYGLMPYFFSKTLLELPLAFFAPLITVSTMYKLIGLRSEWLAYLGIVLSAQLMSTVGAAMGLALGALFPNFEVAMSLMPAITLPMMIFGGVQINLDSIPWYFRFMPVISPVKYAFSSMALLEFRDLPFKDCQPGSPCSGNEALRMFSLDGGPTIIENWLVLILMYLIYTATGIFFLWRASRK